MLIQKALPKQNTYTYVLEKEVNQHFKGIYCVSNIQVLHKFLN